LCLPKANNSQRLGALSLLPAPLQTLHRAGSEPVSDDHITAQLPDTANVPLFAMKVPVLACVPNSTSIRPPQLALVGRGRLHLAALAATVRHMFLPLRVPRIPREATNMRFTVLH
jgi:hypothetical protein